jgi:hypothetical protein
MSTPRPRRANETDAEYQAVLNAAARGHDERNKRAQADMERYTAALTRTPTTTRTPTPTTTRTPTPTTARTPTPTTTRTPTPTTARTPTPTTTTAPSGPPAPGPVHSEHKIPLKRQLAPKEPTPPKMATPTPPSSPPSSPPPPKKKAAGGAAKVRKDMMSPEGKILHAMNKLRGK